MRQERKAIPKTSRIVLLILSNFRAQKEQEYLILVGHPEVSWGGCSWPKAILPGALDTQLFLAATKANRAIAWHTKNPLWYCSTLIRKLSSRASGLKPTMVNLELEGCKLFGMNHSPSLIILMGTILGKSYWLKSTTCVTQQDFFPDGTPLCFTSHRM